MATNPYSSLPESSFWRSGVTDEDPYRIQGVYKKKFNITPTLRIATAGSCFAQHITQHLKSNGYNFIDFEPPPPGLAESLHHKFGFSMYSARYGNIYTVRQLLQLAREAFGEFTPQQYIWERDGKFFDALRPAVEPNGLESPDEAQEHRTKHLAKVKQLFQTMDLFVFTLGLIESWVHIDSQTVFPTAPGVIAGDYDKERFRLEVSSFSSINNDLRSFIQLVKKFRSGKGFKILLTVSPVPLTATATPSHVLVASTYSKSVLRSVAGLWADKPYVSYFPSYEIVTNPRLHSTSYMANLRSVREVAVANAMRHFFDEHGSNKKQYSLKSRDALNADTRDELQCEEALNDAFGS